MNAFSKAKDRFRVTGFLTPAPVSYDPRSNLNQNIKSQYKFDGSYRFGKSERTFIDTNWKPNEQKHVPGPGYY